MKTVYRISIILNILFAGYILFRGGELLLQDYLLRAERTVQEQSDVLTNEAKETAASQECVTCDTIFTVSEYDLSTGRQEVYQQLLPASLIGMNRKQLTEWVDEYNLSATLEDLEKGFLSMELISFSSEEIRVRKRMESADKSEAVPIEQPEQLIQEQSVSENNAVYGYILAQDGFLTVYDGMRRHVILYTDISVFDLPENIQQEIMDGKEVTSQQELYHLLESYSS